MPIAKPKRSIRRKKRHKPDELMMVSNLTSVATIRQFALSSPFFLDIIQFSYNTSPRQLTVIWQGTLPTEERERRRDILLKYFKTLKLRTADASGEIAPEPVLTLRLEDSQTSGSSTMYWVLSAAEDTSFQQYIQFLTTLNLDSQWGWGQ